MLVATMLLVGAVLVGVALIETPVRRMPLSSALVYLVAGWLAASAAPSLFRIDLYQHAGVLRVASEWAVLVSLFSIGLKLGLPSSLPGWRMAALLAGTGMLATVALAAAAAWTVLGLGWGAALLLAAIVAPTDPVLASDVQVHVSGDRDTVRLALTAEGALNDGTAFPLVMLGLGVLGLHPMGEMGLGWLWFDLLWPMGGGAAVGWFCGRSIAWALQRLRRHGLPVSWDELLYLGTIAACYGLATGLKVSSFLAVFLAGVALFHGRRPVLEEIETLPPQPVRDELRRRMMAFGERCERLVEVLMVLVIGVLLASVTWRWETLLFALLLLAVVRPLAVWVVVWPKRLPARQRRLIAWFGVRGVGSLFYAVFALTHGLQGVLAQQVVSACLVCIALSILLHGVSATPLMERYQRRQGRSQRPP